MKRKLLTLAAMVVVAGVGLAIVYDFIVSGGLRARQTPSALESFVAGRLVDWSFPAEAKAR